MLKMDKMQDVFCFKGITYYKDQNNHWIGLHKEKGDNHWTLTDGTTFNSWLLCLSICLGWNLLWGLFWDRNLLVPQHSCFSMGCLGEAQGCCTPNPSELSQERKSQLFF